MDIAERGRLPVVFKPEDVGALEVQVPNGVLDIVVADEATTIANKYLSYFQGRIDTWEVHDQRELRHVVPENRLRVYDVRRVIALVGDVDSVLELRPEFGLARVTAFARVEGRPVGIIANKAMHLGGAIDGDASDKASPMFVTGSNLGVLVFMLVLRKSYGLGRSAWLQAASVPRSGWCRGQLVNSGVWAWKGSFG